MSNDWQLVEQQAIRELQEEERRKAIDLVKDKLRKRKASSWWIRWFPYRIKIERVN